MPFADTIHTGNTQSLCTARRILKHFFLRLIAV
jgi:hypothetical protein